MKNKVVRDRTVTYDLCQPQGCVRHPSRKEGKGKSSVFWEQPLKDVDLLLESQKLYSHANGQIRQLQEWFLNHKLHFCEHGYR